MAGAIGSRNSLYAGKLVVGPGGIVNNGGGTVNNGPSVKTLTMTVASGASAVLNADSVLATTITVSGSTNITTATGFNFQNIAAPTITSVSAITITNSATVAIQNAPTAGGSITITNAYALWVVAGGVRIGGSLTIDGGNNIILSATTGTKIGTATTQKLAFWNVTPVIQPATTGTTTGFTVATGTAVLAGSTFTGNTGASAYTIGDIVLALKQAGIMAA